MYLIDDDRRRQRRQRTCKTESAILKGLFFAASSFVTKATETLSGAGAFHRGTSCLRNSCRIFPSTGLNPATLDVRRSCTILPTSTCRRCCHLVFTAAMFLMSSCYQHQPPECACRATICASSRQERASWRTYAGRRRRRSWHQRPRGLPTAVTQWNGDGPDHRRDRAARRQDPAPARQPAYQAVLWFRLRRLRGEGSMASALLPAVLLQPGAWSVPVGLGKSAAPAIAMRR